MIPPRKRKGGDRVDAFRKHQAVIARRTLAMTEPMAKIMGGMTKEEAQRVLEDEQIIDRDLDRISKIWKGR
jgi:hypothetical protein